MLKKAILIAAFIALTAAYTLPVGKASATADPVPTPSIGDPPSIPHLVYLPIVIALPERKE